MSSTRILSDLPNQYTPMAFLTPEEAEEYQVAANIFFGSIGALTWDWLMAMPDEYRILSRRGEYTSKIVYVCARVFSLAFCLSTAMFEAAPVSNCQALMYTIAIFNILAVGSNNLLFFLRVRAVYGKSLAVTVFFGFWYLVSFGTTLGTPFAVNAIRLGPTVMCVETKLQAWLASAMIGNAVYSTLVFLAISYRIGSHTMGSTGWFATVRSFLRADGAPRVVKALLHNSQLCYLPTILMSIAQVILVFGPRYQATFTVPAIALENVMTCRVHRAVILSLMNERDRLNAPLILTTLTIPEYALHTKHGLGPGQTESPADAA